MCSIKNSQHECCLKLKELRHEIEKIKGRIMFTRKDELISKNEVLALLGNAPQTKPDTAFVYSIQGIDGGVYGD